MTSIRRRTVAWRQKRRHTEVRIGITATSEQLHFDGMCSCECVVGTENRLITGIKARLSQNFNLYHAVLTYRLREKDGRG